MRDGEQLGGPNAIGRPGRPPARERRGRVRRSISSARAPASPRAAATSSTPPTRTRARTSSGSCSRTSARSRARGSTTTLDDAAPRRRQRLGRGEGPRALRAEARRHDALHAPAARSRPACSRRPSRTPGDAPIAVPSARRRHPVGRRGEDRAGQGARIQGTLERSRTSAASADSRATRSRRPRARSTPSAAARGRTPRSARTCALAPGREGRSTRASSSWASVRTRRASSSELALARRAAGRRREDARAPSRRRRRGASRQARCRTSGIDRFQPSSPWLAPFAGRLPLGRYTRVHRRSRRQERTAVARREGRRRGARRPCRSPAPGARVVVRRRRGRGDAVQGDLRAHRWRPPTPDFGPAHAAGPARNQATTVDGIVDVALAPGAYRVTASRGPEYALATVRRDARARRRRPTCA